MSLTIGKDAFRNNQITNITIPSDISSIDNGAFSENPVTLVDFETGLTSIDNIKFGDVFDNTNTNIKIDLANTNIHTVPDDTFSNFSELTEIVFPDTITLIEENSFDNTDNITNIGLESGGSNYPAILVPKIAQGLYDDIPVNVNDFFPSSFKNSTFDNIDLTLYTNIKRISQSLFENNSNLTSITVPATITNIENNAFLNCTSLKSVTFQSTSTVTNLGENTFQNCSSLTSISIPSSITNIGTNCFKGCSQITDIVFNTPDSDLHISDNAFENTNISHLTLPNLITNIGSNSFLNCNSLQKVTFEHGIPIESTKNNVSVFSNTNSSGLNNIFGYKYNLGLIFEFINAGRLSNSFSYTNNLTNLLIPHSVTYIGANTFSNCTNLKNIVFASTNLVIESTAFTNSLNNVTINLPYGNPFYNLSNAIHLTDNTTSKSYDYQFFKHQNNSTYNKYDSAVPIHRNFYNNNSILDNLNFTADEFYKFDNLTQLTSTRSFNINIPDYLFQNTQIGSIKLYPYVTSIGVSAFNQCSNLTDITFNNNNSLTRDDGLKTFWDMRDYSNDNLSDFYNIITQYNSSYPLYSTIKYTFDNNVTTLFYFLYNKETLLPSFGTNAFSNCTNLTQLIIPNGITSIQDNSFTSFDKITNIHLPKTINTIGSNAFNNTLLNKITFSNDLVSTFPTFQENSLSNIQYINTNGITLEFLSTNLPSSSFYNNIPSIDINIELSGKITNIPDNAFNNVTNIKNIKNNRLKGNIKNIKISSSVQNKNFGYLYIFDKNYELLNPEYTPAFSTVSPVVSQYTVTNSDIDYNNDSNGTYSSYYGGDLLGGSGIWNRYGLVTNENSNSDGSFSIELKNNNAGGYNGEYPQPLGLNGRALAPIMAGVDTTINYTDSSDWGIFSGIAFAGLLEENWYIELENEPNTGQYTRYNLTRYGRTNLNDPSSFLSDWRDFAYVATDPPIEVNVTGVRRIKFYTSVPPTPGTISDEIYNDIVSKLESTVNISGSFNYFTIDPLSGFEVYGLDSSTPGRIKDIKYENIIAKTTPISYSKLNTTNTYELNHRPLTSSDNFVFSRPMSLNNDNLYQYDNYNFNLNSNNKIPNGGIVIDVPSSQLISGLIYYGEYDTKITIVYDDDSEEDFILNSTDSHYNTSIPRPIHITNQNDPFVENKLSKHIHFDPGQIFFKQSYNHSFNETNSSTTDDNNIQFADYDGLFHYDHFLALKYNRYTFTSDKLFSPANYSSNTISNLSDTFIQHIGSNAFKGTTNITQNIVLPSSITALGDNAFNTSRINSIDISNSTLINTIPTACFIDSKITYFNLPNITIFEQFAFKNCDELTEITSSSINNLLHINDNCFENCGKLAKITFNDSLLTIKNNSFKDCTALTEITFGNSIKSIGNFAFSGCTQIESLSFSESITNIGISAFSGCTNLTSVTFGNALLKIDIEAFKNTSIESLSFGIFLTEIGNNAFEGCTSITSLSIENALNLLGESAFSGCINIPSFTVPLSLKKISKFAFNDNSSLTQVTFDDFGSLTEISESAFENCNLLSLRFPSTLNIIGNNAFGNNSNLTNIDLNNNGGNITSIGLNALGDTSNTTITNSGNNFIVRMRGAAGFSGASSYGGAGGYGSYLEFKLDMNNIDSNKLYISLGGYGNLKQEASRNANGGGIGAGDSGNGGGSTILSTSSVDITNSNVADIVNGWLDVSDNIPDVVTNYDTGNNNINYYGQFQRTAYVVHEESADWTSRNNNSISTQGIVLDSITKRLAFDSDGLIDYPARYMEYNAYSNGQLVTVNKQIIPNKYISRVDNAPVFNQNTSYTITTQDGRVSFTPNAYSAASLVKSYKINDTYKHILAVVDEDDNTQITYEDAYHETNAFINIDHNEIEFNSYELMDVISSVNNNSIKSFVNDHSILNHKYVKNNLNIDYLQPVASSYIKLPSITRMQEIQILYYPSSNTGAANTPGTLPRSINLYIRNAYDNHFEFHSNIEVSSVNLSTSPGQEIRYLSMDDAVRLNGTPHLIIPGNETLRTANPHLYTTDENNNIILDQSQFIANRADTGLNPIPFPIDSDTILNNPFRLRYIIDVDKYGYPEAQDMILVYPNTFNDTLYLDTDNNTEIARHLHRSPTFNIIGQTNPSLTTNVSNSYLINEVSYNTSYGGLTTRSNYYSNTNGTPNGTGVNVVNNGNGQNSADGLANINHNANAFYYNFGTTVILTRLRITQPHRSGASASLHPGQTQIWGKEPNKTSWTLIASTNNTNTEKTKIFTITTDKVITEAFIKVMKTSYVNGWGTNISQISGIYLSKYNYTIPVVDNPYIAIAAGGGGGGATTGLGGYPGGDGGSSSNGADGLGFVDGNYEITDGGISGTAGFYSIGEDSIDVDENHEGGAGGGGFIAGKAGTGSTNTNVSGGGGAGGLSYPNLTNSNIPSGSEHIVQVINESGRQYSDNTTNNGTYYNNNAFRVNGSIHTEYNTTNLYPYVEIEQIVSSSNQTVSIERYDFQTNKDEEEFQNNTEQGKTFEIDKPTIKFN